MKRRGRPDHSVAGKGRREELKSKERKEKEVNVFKKNAKTDEKKKKEISQRTKAKKTERSKRGTKVERMNILHRQFRQKDTNKNDEIQQLQEEKNHMNSKMQELRQEKSEMDNDILQLRQENINKINENRQLEQKVTNKINQIQQLQQENTNKNNQIQQLRQENTNKNNQIQQLRQENTNKNNQIQQLQQENTNKNNQIQQLRQEKTNKNNQIQQLRQEIADKNNENRELRQDNTNKNNEIRQLQEDTISSLSTKSGSVIVSKEVLGRGAWGAVYTGDFYGTKVAVKEFHEIILSPYNLQILQREIKIASQCRHPNLLQFICATKSHQDHLLIVTELMDKALRTVIEQHAREGSQLKYREVKSISLDVARGLNYLHLKTPNPIIHRDVSSANVLLWIENDVIRRAKISDYGSANFMQVCNTGNPGAALYAAPEASRAQQDPKIDVFSYGLLVCEMSICQLPDQIERRNQMRRIPHIGVKNLVRRCTESDPKSRPTMQGVIASWQNME